ncbi:helix-turn-helix domain-containing protein [Leptodesmis sp.]|uniref:helix-turn-helix domain-containing protein n=1 Tax=Leptodesmis sp. TaxID=3100501 RepID=UPI0040534D3B
MKNQALQKMGNEQAELLTEIGAYLRQVRQLQELSLETVTSITKIPVRTLQAIEDGNLAQLPEPVYIQGFIRRYADAIGTDGAELANAFPTGAIIRPVKPTWKSAFKAQLRPLHLYILYMLLVVGAVIGLSYTLNRSASQASRYAYLTKPVSPGQYVAPGSNEFYGPSAPTQIGKTAAKKIAPTTSCKPVRVGLTLTAQSWLRITVDGKTEFEGVLPEGTQRTWEANKQVIVRAGDAGAVLVSHNEERPQLMGKPGVVEEKQFDASSHASGQSLVSPTTTAQNAVL